MDNFKHLWNGEKKKIARHIALDFQSSDKHAGIFLPGPELKCVKDGLKLGTISNNKKLYFVERNKFYAASIKKNMIYFPNSILHSNNLLDLNIKDSLDLVYLDLMGSMNEDLFLWIKKNIVYNLVCPFRVSFLFTWAWRPKIPFLIKKCREYKNNGKLFNISFFEGCENKEEVATYICLIDELFMGLDYNWVRTNNKSYYIYNDNINPVVLYTLESNHSPENKKLLLAKEDILVKHLIDKFKNAVNNYDKMRGFKKSLTHYCRKKSKEFKKSEYEYRFLIKNCLSELGFDVSNI